MLNKRQLLTGLVAAPLVVIGSGILMPLRGQILKPHIKPVFFYGNEYEGQSIKVVDKIDTIADRVINDLNLPTYVKPYLKNIGYFCNDEQSTYNDMVSAANECGNDVAHLDCKARAWVKVEPVKGRGLSARETIIEAIKFHNG